MMGLASVLRFVLLIIAVSVATVNAHSKVEGYQQRQTLVGVDKIYLYVNTGLSRGGPIQKNLELALRQRLEAAGLQIVQNEGDAEGSLPSLCLDVVVVKGTDDVHTFFITFKLFQKVTLMKGGEAAVAYAATWSDSRLGVGGVKIMENRISLLTDIFLIDYKGVNKVTSP